MKHKAVRIDNLMYKGCEPHWKCVLCGICVPFHCYTKEEFEQLDCKIIIEDEDRRADYATDPFPSDYIYIQNH